MVLGIFKWKVFQVKVKKPVTKTLKGFPVNGNSVITLSMMWIYQSGLEFHHVKAGSAAGVSKRLTEQQCRQNLKDQNDSLDISLANSLENSLDNGPENFLDNKTTAWRTSWTTAWTTA